MINLLSKICKITEDENVVYKKTLCTENGEETTKSIPPASQLQLIQEVDNS